MSKFPPLFQRVWTDSDKEGAVIAEIQREFEKFWRSVQKKCPNNSEKTLAMRKMQEACMWLTRAVAIGGFKPTDDTVITIKKSDLDKCDLSVFQNQPATKIVALGDSIDDELKNALKSKNKMAGKPIC